MKWVKRGRGLGVLLADGLVVIQELTNHVPAVLRSSFGTTGGSGDASSALFCICV